MSRYSQVVSARKLVNSPCRPAMPLAFVDDLFGHLLQGRQSVVAAVFDHDLETAGRAEAVDGRRTEDVDHAFLNLGFELFFELLRQSRRPTGDLSLDDESRRA